MDSDVRFILAMNELINSKNPAEASSGRLGKPLGNVLSNWIVQELEHGADRQTLMKAMVYNSVTMTFAMALGLFNECDREQIAKEVGTFLKHVTQTVEDSCGELKGEGE